MSSTARLCHLARSSIPGPRRAWGLPAPSPTGGTGGDRGVPPSSPQPPPLQNNTIFEKVLEVTVKDSWRLPNSEFGPGDRAGVGMGMERELPPHHQHGGSDSLVPLQTAGWDWPPSWASPSAPSSSGHSSPPGSGTSTHTPVSIHHPGDARSGMGVALPHMSLAGCPIYPPSPKPSVRGPWVSEGPGCCAATIHMALPAMPQGNDPAQGGHGSSGSPHCPGVPPATCPPSCSWCHHGPPCPSPSWGLRGRLGSNL